MRNEPSKKELMRDVVAANLNSIPAADSNTSEGFLENASNWLGSWWRHRQKWQSVTPGYCALVFDPDFTEKSVFNEYTHVRLFREAKAKNLGGAIYVTDYTLNKVYRKQGEFDDANSVVKELENAGLAASPCVIFEPEAGILLLAQDGVDQQVVKTRFGNFDGQLAVENVSKLLDDFYNSTLKYPETFPHVWFDKENFVPIFYAEKLYQGLCFIYLRAMTQGTWVVVREDQNNAGRTDLTLRTLHPEIIFVLEMKVLKSYLYNGTNRKNPRPFKPEENEQWADDGIDQLIGYRAAQTAEAAFLLLYDMRDNDVEINSVVKRCAAERIEHRRYYIHNASPRSLRKRGLSQDN